MKTTINIADDVLERAKRLAAQRKTTLKSLAEEGLRLILEQCPSNSVVIKPVITGGNGLCHGLPDDFIDNIRDWAYEDKPSR